MKLTEVAIDRRITVFVLLVLIVGSGFYAYFTLPRESMPEIVIPNVMISVFYTGVAPEDMETLVTMPIERKLSGIPAVKEIRSTSSEGSTFISIEFEADEDMDVAIQRVRDKVDMARSELPEDADDPIVTEVNSGQAPVIFVNFIGDVGPEALTEVAKDMQDEIETLPGVLEVKIVGEVEREIQIEIDPARLQQYGVSLSDLVQITQFENVNTPAGSMQMGEAKYLMRVPGEIRSAEDLHGLVVKRGKVGIVYLRDLAEIREGFKRVTSYSRLNEEPSISLSVSKRSGENVIEVSRNVTALVEAARENLPAGIRAVISGDESQRIGNDVEQLENSILTGLLLVLAVILLFMGFTNAFFISMAIPLSLLLTFMIMRLVGLTLNNVTLFGLMVSLGMLVDNGIVVVENIYRHGQEGKSRIQAAKEGTAEVAWPIFASTITTICAFFPMVFWPGMMGKFMNLLPKVVIIALAASLFVGLIVNPAMAAMFIHPKPMAAKAKRHPVLDFYGKVLRLALRWRAVTLVTTLTVIVVIVQIYMANFRFIFLSEVEPMQASVNVDGPEGASLEATNAIVEAIEAIVAPQADNIEFIMSSVGSQNSMGGGGGFMGGGGGETSHKGQVTLDFDLLINQEVLPSKILQSIRHSFDHIVGAEVRISEMAMGPGQGAPVNIEISGEEFAVLDEIRREVRNAIKDTPGLVDLQDDMEGGKPEVRVVIDREQALLAKLNTQYIGQTVLAAVNGRKVGEYRVGDEARDVVVKFPDAFREDLSNFDSLTLINMEGKPIPFGAVARLEQGTGLGSVKRKDGKRMVTISGEAEGRPGTEVLADVRARIDELEALPPGYAISYTGENENVNETTRFLITAFVLAMFLISIVLITQFNSVLQSMVIMSSVIMSLGGVFFGLLIFDMPFGVMMSGIGCVSLAGIVVNNAIVLVDFINKLRARGRSVEDAIVEAGQKRFRPVMLTALTTILGMIPIAVGFSFDFRKFEWNMGSESSQYWGPMAMAIIFGLAFATVLTLVVIPTLYSLTASVTRQKSSSDMEELALGEPVAK